MGEPKTNIERYFRPVEPEVEPEETPSEGLVTREKTALAHLGPAARKFVPVFTYMTNRAIADQSRG